MHARYIRWYWLHFYNLFNSCIYVYCQISFICEKWNFTPFNNDFIVDKNLFKNWQIKFALDKIFFVCENIHFICDEIYFICEILYLIYDKKKSLWEKLCVSDKMNFNSDKTVVFLSETQLNFPRRLSWDILLLTIRVGSS